MKFPAPFKVISSAILLLSSVSLHAQQGWETNALTSAEYYFASNAFGPAAQYYQMQPYYPNLADQHKAANFYTLASVSYTHLTLPTKA